MVRVSLALGIIATIAGLMAIGFGIPIQAFGLGNTLILSGATVFSAGLVVVALSLVLRAIERLSQELSRTAAAEPESSHVSFEHQPVAPSAERPVAPPQSPSEWAPVAPPHEEISPAERREPRRSPLPARSGWQDEEAEPAPPLPPVARPPGAPAPRLERETIPAPREREAAARPRFSGRAERPPREPVVERPQPAHEAERQREPVVRGEVRDEGGGGGGGGGEPRVDPYAPPERRRIFGWTRRSKERRDEVTATGGHETEPEIAVPASAAPRAPQGPPESRDLPRRPARGASPEPRERMAPAPRAAGEQPHHAEQAPPVEVLKQGTVDGMSYTLYTDGSIDAEFPEGRIRFNSIDELRLHLEAQG